MRITELNNKSDITYEVKKFLGWAKKHLGITDNPKIKLSTNKNLVKSKRTFGTTYSNGEIWVYVKNRNCADILRTLCHELVHFKQFQKGTAHEGMDEDEKLKIEDEANAIAGRMLRDYGKINSEIYESKTGSLQHEVADSLPQAYVIPELNSGNPYQQYKFGVAIAGQRGKQQRESDGIGSFKESDLDKVFADSEVVVSFDPNIDKIIDAALDEIGVHASKRMIGVKGSKESKDVLTRSPITPFKGYGR